ncbi:MAG: hypothetical protein AMXMBFR53_09440 [Gemmatimonadota bacterium]
MTGLARESSPGWETVRRWAGVIATRRIYDPPHDSDGRRILVDRLWPRGVSRDGPQLDAWIPAVAPSDELRRWFGHEPDRWVEFRQRYFDELTANPGLAEVLARECRGERVTFLFAARDEQRNNAVALKAFVDAAMEPRDERAGTGNPDSDGAADSGLAIREAMERARRSCIDAAIRAYEDAGVRGLCAEGRWELAIDAMRHLDLE